VGLAAFPWCLYGDEDRYAVAVPSWYVSADAPPRPYRAVLSDRVDRSAGCQHRAERARLVGPVSIRAHPTSSPDFVGGLFHCRGRAACACLETALAADLRLPDLITPDRAVGVCDGFSVDRTLVSPRGGVFLPRRPGRSERIDIDQLFCDVGTSVTRVECVP
jgi:hypothetical protein